MDAKLDVKKDGKKDAIDGVLRNCTIAPGLAPHCSPKLGKITLKSGAKFDAKSSFCCSDRYGFIYILKFKLCGQFLKVLVSLGLHLVSLVQKWTYKAKNELRIQFKR